MGFTVTTHDGGGYQEETRKARCGRPAGTTPSQAERGVAPLSLVLDRRLGMG
jgi:hypothetical protein